MRSNETVILLQVLKHLEQEIQALKSSVTDIANTLERLEETGAFGGTLLLDMESEGEEEEEEESEEGSAASAPW
tara:strand:- start:102 stop:323 length:222 start_codon:yes stop_codon:yes gene_type:complete